MNALTPTRPEVSSRPADPGPRRLPVHDARVLTAGADRAQILLDGKVYDLRITRAGKLILTK